MTIIISKPELVAENGSLLYCVRITISGEIKNLWFRLSDRYANLVSERSDAALAALLIPAMSLGENIQLEGTVSERLYYNLSGPYQEILKQIIPSLHTVSIIPSDVRPAHQTGTGVALGFSGGIDSFCALTDHYYANVPEGFKVTHLLFNNVGSHESGEKGRQLFKKRYERLKPVTEQIGLPFIAIDSNMDSFYETLDFEQTHTQRNASVALLLQRGIKRFYYAAGYHYSEVFVGPAHSMAYSDPVTLPLISNEAVDMISTGSEYTRVKKTLKVTQIKESYKSLDVCVHAENRKNINCSSCYKCKRTMLTLELAGYLDRYADVFDIGSFRNTRERYIAEVLCSREPLLREIADFIKSSGFKIPLMSRIYAHTRFFLLTDYIKRMVKKTGFNRLKTKTLLKTL